VCCSPLQWSTIFPTEQVTEQQSALFVKKLLAVAVSGSSLATLHVFCSAVILHLTFHFLHVQTHTHTHTTYRFPISLTWGMFLLSWAEPNLHADKWEVGWPHYTQICTRCKNFAVQSDCSIWRQILKCCNLIGLQNSCSGTNLGIAMSPNLPLFFWAWRLGSAQLVLSLKCTIFV